MNESARGLVDLIREIVQEELQNRDSTMPCIIESVNVDNTVNIIILPDRNTIITNIINATKYQFVSGDIAIIYKIQNNLNNAFIIAKFNF